MVTIAPNGDSGLELARRLRPDFITLDVMMPGVDGWAVLATLKSDASLSGIPVAVISMSSARNMALSLGAAAYLDKPVNRDQLASELTRLRPVPTAT